MSRIGRSVALAFVVLAAAVEIGLAMPVAGWLYALAFCASVALLGIGGRGTVCRRDWALLAGCGAAMVVLCVVPWTSRKPFLRDLHRIRTGMTEAEARHLMAGYLEGTGWPASPFDTAGKGKRIDSGIGRSFAVRRLGHELALDGALVFRHSEDGAFDSDWGIVEIREGRGTDGRHPGVDDLRKVDTEPRSAPMEHETPQRGREEEFHGSVSVDVAPSDARDALADRIAGAGPISLVHRASVAERNAGRSA